jgi:hypothetical protein
VERLAAKLIADRFHYLRIAVADVEDPEAAQAVDIGPAVEVAIGVRPGIGPFDDRTRVLRVGRLAILEKPGIDVFSKRLDRLTRDPRGIRGRDLGLFDQP